MEAMTSDWGGDTFRKVQKLGDDRERQGFRNGFAWGFATGVFLIIALGGLVLVVRGG